MSINVSFNELETSVLPGDSRDNDSKDKLTAFLKKRFDDLPYDIITMIIPYVGNPAIAAVNRAFYEAAREHELSQLKHFLINPRIAPFVPQANEIPSAVIRKTYENVRKIADSILNELPQKLKELALLDLEPLIVAVEDRNLLRVFEKICRKIRRHLPPNRSPETSASDANKARIWMNRNRDLLGRFITFSLADLHLTTVPLETRLIPCLDNS